MTSLALASIATEILINSHVDLGNNIWFRRKTKLRKKNNNFGFEGAERHVWDSNEIT